MKFSLRTLALGAAFLAVGAMTAQDVPTVTQKWICHEGVAEADVRAGNGYNGKVYVTNGTAINMIENGTVTTLFTYTSALNKGLFIDDAGNIAVHIGFPGSAANWMNFLLVKADGSASKEITLAAPTDCDWAGNRSDVNGRAIGDFFSEDGGVLYLTASTQTYPIPVWICNGVVDPISYATDARFAAANTTAVAQPALTFDEIDSDNVCDAFYYYTGNSTSGTSAWNIGYVNEDGEAAYLPEPAEDQIPEGWAKQSQNGFDVFELGGKKYIIRMSGEGAWNSNFLINDEEGNVIFHTNYGEGWNNPALSGNTGSGCGVYARKVNENTVEIYQIFKCGVIENSFAAVYEVKLGGDAPEQNLYIAGAFQNWDPQNAAEFTRNDDGTFSFNYVQENVAGFKMSTVKGDWDTFNSGVLGVQGNVIATGNTYDLVEGLSDDLNIADGNYTLTVDLAAMTLTVTGEPSAFVAPTLYLRGDFNSWGYDETSMLAASEVSEEGDIVYTISRETLEGGFKIANDNWGINFGMGTIPGAGTYSVAKDADNMTLPSTLKNITLKLTINKSNLYAGTLVVTGTLYGTPHAYAYNVKGAMGENDTYVVTFKSTEAAEEADVVVKDADGQTVATTTIQGVVKGENTITVDLSDLAADATYTWSVRVISSNDYESAAVGYVSPEWIMEAPVASKGTTAGVVWMRDTESDAYGYSVYGMGCAHGFAVYDPEMNLVGDQLYHSGFEKFTSSNGSSVTRGDALRNYAVFADWSDKASGYWRLDVLNPAAEPVNMLMSEGATMASSGAVTLNGVEIGSGTPAVAFRGTGENTQMFGFDEDVYGNALVRYDLGEALYVTAAPAWVTPNKSLFANTNINVIARENGYWVGQVRAAITDANVPGLMYFDNDNDLVWGIYSDDAFAEIPGTSSGFAVSLDNSLFAMSSYNDMKIHVFSIAWEDNEPSFTEIFEFDQLPAVNKYTAWAQMTFDAANNLMVYDRRIGRMVTYVLPGGAMATTAAKAEYAFHKESGIEGVTVGTDEAPVEYYNLQGMRVEAENLSNGVYIRKQGNNATKVVIR